MSSGPLAPRQPQRITERAQLRRAARVVVKIGSSSLTLPSGRLDEDRVRELAAQAARLRGAGAEVVIVSSGAIAAALGPLGLERRPEQVAAQQAAASVGQVLLAAAWAAAFAQHGLLTGQVLLTEADVVRAQTYRNARASLEALLGHGVVPVVNENDTTATHEIRFGDNDRLAALVAQLLGADALALLTDVDGLHTAPPHEPGAERIPLVPDVSRLEGVSIGAVGSRVGTGGMVTKLAATQLAAGTGTAVVLTTADRFGAAVRGEDVGTFFPALQGRRRSRMVWLRFATRGAGTLRVDEGAADALRTRRRSLLAVGVTAVEGSFPAGVPVDVVGPEGEALARGLVDASSDELRAIMGERGGRPVLHRDRLVVL